jgi:hypothetical protein
LAHAAREAFPHTKDQKNYQNKDHETGVGLAGFGARRMRNRQLV